ncbi:MAG: hypothetical protein U1E78_09635 [Gammaproteobacteria bacterium]
MALQFPANWSSAKNLITNIKNIHSKNSEIKIMSGDTLSQKIISIPDSIESFNITYDVYAAEEITLFQPMITHDFFHFIGHTAFAYPLCVDTSKMLDVRLKWENFTESSASQGGYTKSMY